MSGVAVESTKPSRVSVPRHAPGSAFFAFVAGLWGAFVALLAASPSTLADAYDWLRGLPFVWELLVWILTLPWAVAYVVYETAWAHWLRVLLVTAIVAAHLAACAPRERR